MIGGLGLLGPLVGLSILIAPLAVAFYVNARGAREDHEKEMLKLKLEAEKEKHEQHEQQMRD